ncbi:MAG: hypothetical protein RLZZ271_211 [Pseudomonadota bacterium]|jgi:uncharacterized membrane protein YkgB
MGKIAKFTWNVPYMSIFYRPQYSSEVTQFLDSLKKANPELEAGQREGRALLWDKQLDRQAQSEQQAARVRQKPYVYQTNA